MEQTDRVLCECELEPLENFVRAMEPQCTVKVIRQPAIAMTMIKAEDSVEGQSFYLGEALITECEVAVDGQVGYGICLGDEPVRSYCIAFIDALLNLSDPRSAQVQDFLRAQEALLTEQLQQEHQHIQRTKVDFKLMEEE